VVGYELPVLSFEGKNCFNDFGKTFFRKQSSLSPRKQASFFELVFKFLAKNRLTIGEKQPEINY